MKKIISLGLVLGMAAFLVWALPASAKNEGRPKGLEDKGPLTKITFIHYKKGYAKPPKPPRPDKPDKDKKIACYGFLGRGVYWKENIPRNLYFNPEGSGMDADDVEVIFDRSANTWDSVTGEDLFGEVELDFNADWDDSAPNYNSELIFDDYPDPSVIAVTVIWGYFGGPPQLREIVDFDILFNTDYFWGIVADGEKVMDLENIATHEMGHGWGLGDMYDTACSDVTMYGYSSEGETTKRSLDIPDITGIQELYGVFSE